MENVIIALSKYIIIILFASYTLYCFTCFRSNNKKKQNWIFKKQRFLMFFIHFICNVLLFLNTKDIKIIFFYLAQVFLFIGVICLYEYVYLNLSKLVLNNMLMLFVVSFVMLTRISFNKFAVRQFCIVAIGMGFCLFVPFIIDKLTNINKYGWLFAVLGIGLLSLVFIVGANINGATNWIRIFGIGLQPSEFVKIIFVFFVAALLADKEKLKFIEIVKVSAVAAVYVLVLVKENDLGGALIFFITYLALLYTATAQPAFLLLGLSAGSVAAYMAYHMFEHVKVRVRVWIDPWSEIDNKGCQVAQSLFAIGTGGWFGMGLGKGLEGEIPIEESDFIFPRIAEEFGSVFAFCIVLIYISCFIMFINIAMKIKKQFYKLTALGLSVVFIFQVFLTLGGVTKLIPSTGVTLPLVSYGGSSVLSTIIMFNIIQGLYVLNQSEGEAVGKRKKRKSV